MEEIQVLVEQKNGVLDFNFEQIKEQLTKEMDLYSSLVFSEDQKALAKKDIASLRKLKTAIDAKRKEVKKSFMAPYDEFESKVKELIALIDQPIALIDKQVSEFEEKQKAEKQEKIKEIYADIIDDIDYIPLESIYKKEWENASTSLKSIKTDMEEKIFHINQDLHTLDAFESDACEKAKATYLSNGYNLGPCVQYIQQYEQQKKEIEEREKARQEQERIRKEQEEKKAEEERIRKEQEDKIKEEMRLAEEQRKKEVEQISQEEPGGFQFDEEPQGFTIPEPKIVKRVFEFKGTEEAIENVYQYIKAYSDVNLEFVTYFKED